MIALSTKLTSTRLGLNITLSCRSIVINTVSSDNLNRQINRKRLVEFNKSKMSDHVTLSYVTAPSLELARKLAKELIKGRLAACINIVRGVESVYEWNDKIENDEEHLLIIKSYSTKTLELTAFIEQNHPYECPEVLTVKVDSGSTNYLKWVEKCVNKSKSAID